MVNGLAGVLSTACVVGYMSSVWIRSGRWYRWYAAPQAVTKPPRWPPQLPLCDADAGYHFLCDSEDITLHTKLDLPTFDYLHRIIYNGFQGCSGDRRPSQSHLVLLKLARQAPEG